MRRGLTLIEILVVIGIVFLLAAIALPALFAARAAAQNLACVNNLKQLSLALTNYASTDGVFPITTYESSVLVKILPHLEQGAIYDSINFSVSGVDFIRANEATVATMTIAAFLCPADTGNFAGGMTNYALNAGIGTIISAPFSAGRRITYLDYKNVTDGLSHTAFGSEWLKGTPSNPSKTRSVFQTQYYPFSTGGFAPFCAACGSLDRVQPSHLIKGKQWLVGGFGWNLYNHALPPDSPSCTNGTLLIEAAWTVSSNHGGKTNVFYGDGHVSPSRREVDQTLWRALGTMNGGEVTSD